MASALKELKQEIKNFTDSKQTGNDFLKLFMAYDRARKNSRVSEILKALEEQTRTQISDELYTLF